MPKLDRPPRSLILMAALAVSACAGTVVPASVPPPTRTSPTATRPTPAPAPLPREGRAPMPLPASLDPGFARPPPGLSDTIFQLWKAFPGKTGIAVARIDGDWQLAWRENDLFPQQSVSKLWVALSVLDAIDRGEAKLTDRVRITRDDLTLFSQPIAARVLAEGSISPTVAELLEQAVNRSDNTANDSLQRHIGGPQKVRDFIARKKLGAIRFGPGERLLQAQIAGLTWEQSMSLNRGFEAARAKLPPEVRKAAMDRYLADPIDGMSPGAAARALTRLARGELLSAESTKYALDLLERTRTGPNRLRAGLPPGWRWGNKTGTGQNLPPITAGYNDIGIATAPDGTRYAIVVLLADTTASIPARMQLMQAVSRAVAEGHGR
ncbi:MAG: serine hydrolase [Sphingopyxis sp.]|nr:serine hydrolase [Sphingopyxis sp.]